MSVREKRREQAETDLASHVYRKVNISTSACDRKRQEGVRGLCGFCLGSLAECCVEDLDDKRFRVSCAKLMILVNAGSEWQERKWLTR